MKFIKHFYIIAVLLLYFSIECYSQSCSDEFLVVNKKKFDIRSIKSLPFRFSDGGYDYSFTICDTISNDMCGRCLNSFSGCQRKGWEDWCLGVSSGSNKYEVLPGGKGLAITYDNGDDYNSGCWGGGRRKLRIEIICDKSATSIPTTFEAKEPTCDPLVYEYVFTFRHISGCPFGGGGLSAGSILLIIIFVTFAVYLIAGIIINIVVRQKSGFEIIPNSSFWAGLPSLIRDGVLFICGRRPGGYDTVE